MVVKPFVLPPYPYDQLHAFKDAARERHGSIVDMSIGAPHDAPPTEVVEALAGSGAERGYPPSIGSAEYRHAASRWLQTQCDVTVSPDQIGATIGLKEFVAGLPHWLHLKDPSKDTVLYPAVSYPSYAMGAELAHCRAVAVPVDDQWRMRLDAIDDADRDRALLLWVNSPGNPAGAIEDLGAAASWGRTHAIPVVSDECYIEFIWDGPRQTILNHGTDGVLAVHSLSKRSNLAGVRAGYYAGDPELVHWLREIRKHTGAMMPGPSQHAAAIALGDQGHVDAQRELYQRRMTAMISFLSKVGLDAEMPEGGFYLWVKVPSGTGWDLAEELADRFGLIVSPGDFYGSVSSDYVRIAVVQDQDAIATLEDRLANGAPG